MDVIYKLRERSSSISSPLNIIPAMILLVLSHRTQRFDPYSARKIDEIDIILLALFEFNEITHLVTKDRQTIIQ